MPSLTGYTPQIEAYLMPIPARDDAQLSPPVWWVSGAAAWNQESGTQVEGRYLPATGEVSAAPTPKMQDTYLHGTAGLSGREFSITSGTVKDDWVSPLTRKNGLYMPDSASGAAFDVVEYAALEGGLQHSLIRIGRGIPPGDATHDAATINAYLELNAGSYPNYRLCLEYSNPIRFEYQPAAGYAWQPVKTFRRLGDAEHYFERNGRKIDVWIVPDRQRGIFLAEVGEGNWVRLARAEGLPATERIRFSGQNGWATLEVYPLRYGAVKVNKSARNVPMDADLGRFFVIPNGNGRLHPDQQDTGTVSPSGAGALDFTAEGSLPDAGDGLGSAEPPAYTSITILIPARWASGWIGPMPQEIPPVIQVWETQRWDDVTRTGVASAHLVIENENSRFSGRFGNIGVDLSLGNGQLYGPRLRGVIAPGLTTYRQDPVRIAECEAHDFSYKLGRPIGAELQVDRWCIFSAVRALLEIGQISPKYLTRIPFYPYGPAKYDCPWPILGSGMGDTPRFSFPPERSVISCILDLMDDMGAINWYGASVPFWFWFDTLGNARFEPWDPRMQLPVREYSEWEGDVQSIEVFNSTEEIRTDIDFEGQDPFTGELLYMHQPLPWNLPVVGWRYPWFERNSRWVSQAYMDRLRTAGMIQASLPQQTVRIRALYDSRVNAGQVILASERRTLGRTGPFVVTEIQSRVGRQDWSGLNLRNQCESIITARAVENLIPW